MLIDYDQKQFEPKMVILSTLYLLIGGKDLMAAFNMDYNLMYENFIGKDAFPIEEEIPADGPFLDRSAQLNESYTIYNQIIEPFFQQEFNMSLTKLRPCVKFVTKYFIMDLEVEENNKNLEHCGEATSSARHIQEFN